MKYNLGKFNIKGKSSSDISGSSDISIDIQKAICAKVVTIDNANISFNLDTSIETSVIKFFTSDTKEIILDTKIKGSVLKFGASIDTDIILEAGAIGALLGTENISLTNSLILRPGDTLEIDMENLTVTINKENAVHTLSDSSEWFDLLSGDNSIQINANGKSQVDIFWKDRWL